MNRIHPINIYYNQLLDHNLISENKNIQLSEIELSGIFKFAKKVSIVFGANEFSNAIHVINARK